MDTIPLNRPDIRAYEANAVEVALEGMLRGDRASVTALEEAACRAVSRPYGVAASSAGVALEAAMLTLGLRSGDEVICSAYSPARIVGSIIRAGATPRFVDAQPRTGSIDPDQLESVMNDRTRAIAVAPSWFDPRVLEILAALSRKYEIPLVEDAVESLGTTIDADSAGSFGRLSVIGLGSESPACAAGGGVIVTNDERLADTARSILLEGRASTDDPEDTGQRGFDHVRIGIDGRLDPIRAAVAIGVIERLEETIETRRALAERYVSRLGGEPELQIPASAASARPSWPAFPVRLDERFVSEDRDVIIAGLRRHDIIATAGWTLCPALPIVGMRGHGEHEDAWPIAARLAAHGAEVDPARGLVEPDDRVDLSQSKNYIK